MGFIKQHGCCNIHLSLINLSGVIKATAGNAILNIDSHSLIIAPNGYNISEYYATINNLGIIHQSGSALDISSDFSICGIGSISDHVNCFGSLLATSGNSIYLYSGLSISNTGSVNLGRGSLYVNDTISGISGGSLTAINEYIGLDRIGDIHANRRH